MDYTNHTPLENTINCFRWFKAHSHPLCEMQLVKTIMSFTLKTTPLTALRNSEAYHGRTDLVPIQTLNDKACVVRHACAGGHLDVIERYTPFIQHCGLGDHLLRITCRYNHFDLVQYFCDQLGIQPDSACIELAVHGNAIHIARYLASKRVFSYFDVIDHHTLFEIIILNDYVDMLQYFVEHYYNKSPWVLSQVKLYLGSETTTECYKYWAQCMKERTINARVLQMNMYPFLEE
jgi:hypothetical protein